MSEPSGFEHVVQELKTTVELPFSPEQVKNGTARELPPPVPPMPQRAEGHELVHTPDLLAHMKAWVRRELMLLVHHDMSHEERERHNP